MDFNRTDSNRTLEEGMREAAEAIVRRGHAVALTGAGISVPSGIPDFRSPGGIWEKFDPMEYATIDAFLRDPAKVWEFFVELDELLHGAEPNPAHEALARLEAIGLLDGVITQNVDDLHRQAGSKVVVEFHGSGRQLICPSCGGRRDPDPDMQIPPVCPCGQAMKPDVVLFGEPIPVHALEEASKLAGTSRVLIVAGTSAEVAPASAIPFEASSAGSLVVECNLERTRLTGTITDIFLQGPAEVILPGLGALAESIQ